MISSLLAPAAVSGLCALAAAAIPPGRWRDGSLALGTAAGWCLGVWLFAGTPAWPPHQAADWQFYAVAAAGILAVLRPGAPARRLAWSALFFGTFFTLLNFRLFTDAQAIPSALLRSIALTGAALLNVWALTTVGRSVQAAASNFGLTIFSLLVTVALTLGHAPPLARSAAMLAATAGAAWIVFWILRRQVDAGPAAFVATAIFGGLLVQGLNLRGLSPTTALLLSAAWPAAAITAKLLQQASGNLRVAFSMLVLIGTCTAGLLLQGH